MKSSIKITKTTQVTTTWKNEATKDEVSFDSLNKEFYVWHGIEIAATFSEADATKILRMCDALIPIGVEVMHLADGNYIPDLPFLSMVLTEHLHVRTSAAAAVNEFYVDERS